MDFPLSGKLAGHLIWLDQASSTNSQLIEAAQKEALPDFTVMATANQLSGRGRAGRSWEAPANASLAISVLLKPKLTGTGGLSNLGWLPLLGGLAMSEAVAGLLEGVAKSENRKTIGVKWPNDVLVDDLKISGVLSELVSVGPGEAAVVVGAGINLSQASTELPVPTATSLSIAGATLPENLAERFDLVLASYLERLTFWYQRFLATDLDPIASGLRQAVIENCVSLGRQVRAILPGESELVGKALTIDDAGRIVLSVNGLTTPVAAGDIVHLRHN